MRTLSVAATAGLGADQSMLALIHACVLYSERRFPQLLARLVDVRDTVRHPDSAVLELRLLMKGIYFGYKVQDEESGTRCLPRDRVRLRHDADEDAT